MYCVQSLLQQAVLDSLGQQGVHDKGVHHNPEQM